MNVLLGAIFLQAAAFIPTPAAQAEIEGTNGGALTLREGVVMTDLEPFENGVFTVEIFLVPGRAFTGVLFRADDADNGEIFYVRHHQRGNPDAWQYHPRYHAHEAYQIYQGEGFGGAFDTPLGEWVTLTLTICGGTAVARIGDSAIATMPHLVRPQKSGRIGFWALRGERMIRNVQHEKLDDAACPAPALAATAEANTAFKPIDFWRVSEPMMRNDAVSIVGAKNISLKSIPATHRGIADLNVVGPAAGGADTVVARAVLKTTNAETVKLDFGFSDDAAVYLNGKLLFEGSDRFRSRDYRFLGTMGFYDSVPLRLKKGENLLDIVVTEVEGGWGVAGRLRGADGVSVSDQP